MIGGSSVPGSEGSAIRSVPPTSPAGGSVRSEGLQAARATMGAKARRRRIVPVLLFEFALQRDRSTDDSNVAWTRLTSKARRRLLLRQAVKRTQSPHQVDRMNAADFAVGEAVGEDVQGHAIHRIVERRNDHHVVGDVKVRITRR